MVVRGLYLVFALELPITDQKPVEADELRDPGEEVLPCDAECEIVLCYVQGPRPRLREGDLAGAHDVGVEDHLPWTMLEVDLVA